MIRMHKPMRRRKGEAGFTLMEVAISVLVIGVGFTSILSIFSVGLKWAQDVRIRLNAQLFAQTAKYKATDYEAGGFKMDWIDANSVTILDRGGNPLNPPCTLYTP